MDPIVNVRSNGCDWSKASTSNPNWEESNEFINIADTIPVSLPVDDKDKLSGKLPSTIS